LKILFVCSCLEPGLDGVGDYTRRLAAALNALGHHCYMLSLADPQVQKATFCDFGGTNGVLRLPAEDSWPDRLRQAKSFRERVAPDWISWQIVLYGFDPRGLSFGLGRRCREISGGCRNQIMFHEIWIGEEEASPLKNKLIGKLQRLIIKDLLSKLRPLVVHTHTPLYQHLLGGLGHRVTILPLFGNIPLTARPRCEWLKEKWPEGWGQFNLADRDAWWIFVVFGSIHPEWDADDFLQRASAVAQRAGRKCLLISIGLPGAAGERLLRGLQKREGAGWRFLHLGRQPEEDISQCLLMADFGVSAVPPEHLFKSGTAAAMIEHGLQVIATRPVFRYPHCPPEALSVGMRNVVGDLDLEASKKLKPDSLLPAVAGQFIGDLQHAPTAPSRKILLTSLLFAPSIGGIETVSLLLAREFAAAGHSVKVATMTPDDSGASYGFEVLRKPSLAQLVQAARWCDVYFQSNISLPLAAPLLIVRRPWVIVHHAWIPRPTGLSGLNRRLKLFLLCFAHSISISRAIAAALPVKSELIPNPYDANLFYVRDSIARSEDLVALGRLVSDKGFDLLVEALALLAKEGCRPKLTIIGEGPEKQALIQSAKDLGVADQITFLGTRTGTELAQELNRHRIAVIPSRWKEPFGIVALEAIACGCVVVGSQEGGLSDAIGPCGATFPNSDVAALAQALSRLLKTPGLLLQYRRHAEEHLRKHHPSAVANLYLQMFENVCRTRPYGA
jgi:glycogen(starch) synthase